MPYSDYPPPLVWPDTPEGREDAAQKDPLGEIFHGFCSEYELGVGMHHPPGAFVKNACARRDMRGDRSHNWCFRCFAGYPALTYEMLDAFENEGAYSRALKL